MVSSMSPGEARSILRDIPVTDDHMHLDPAGSFLDAVERFSGWGGKRIVLASKPYSDIPVSSGADYRNSFERTLSTCERVNTDTDVECRCVVGPYPVDLVHMSKVMPLEKARDVMMEGAEIAGMFLKEELVAGIGEVGVPHFPVDDTVMDACLDVLGRIMELARDGNGCVVIHMNSPLGADDTEHLGSIVALADTAGLPRRRVVKHFSPGYMSRPGMARGMLPSVLARRKAVIQALDGGDFMLETDFMDEPSRPDQVLPPETVPRTTARLLKSGKLDMEHALRIHRELPDEVYGFQKVDIPPGT